MSESHFDRIAAVYDESLPPHVVEHYLRKRLHFLIEAHPPPARVLDVGCGTGLLAERLARAGYTVTGVDPSEGMLDVLRSRAFVAEAVRASGTELPFEDGTFELVFCVAVMHHVADPAAVAATIAEMVRVLAPGGRTVVWDHNPRNPYWPLLMARVPQDSGQERLIPEAELVSGLEQAGGVVLYSAQLGLVPDFVPARAMRAAAALERCVELTPALRRLCAHNVLVATK